MDTHRQNKNHKILALHAAMNGNPQPLLELKAKQGRAYTEEELECRRLYLAELSNQKISRKDAVNFFGRYEPVTDASFYRLPNGLLLYF
ncbi:hypothetical protein GCM10028818_33150 [Spirosoma horti]